MFSALDRSRFQVRPALLAVAAVVGILSLEAEPIRVRLVQYSGLHGSTLPETGDTVRYQHDGLTYRVVDVVGRTVLLARGDTAVYADQSDVTKLRR